VRSVEHLRLVMAELEVADIRAQVILLLFTEFTKLRSAAYHEESFNEILDQLMTWGSALKAPRTEKVAQCYSTASAS
jgi:beta-xylosidase